MAVICGCYHRAHNGVSRYLPRINASAHTTIISTASKTVLSQTFTNPSSTSEVVECRYAFPLHSGVSVVGFTCQIGSRTIHGTVKEKTKARSVYTKAKSREETAGLLEQGSTSDVFATSLGNIPAGEKVLVKITYVEELKHDLGADGVRFTLPTIISPRYGHAGADDPDPKLQVAKGQLAITVDIEMDVNSPIQEIRSPSHPISVTLGKLSTTTSDFHHTSQASATLSLGTTVLKRDFILEILHKDCGRPRALLETQPRSTGYRALMTTLVPRSSSQSSKPEVIFVADQSGSMGGERTRTLVAALKTFLKSLPVGITFNICFFGSSYTLLFEKSQEYNEDSLAKAMDSLNDLDACYGGTETLQAIRASIEARDSDKDLSLILATDGDIWQQQDLFDYLNTSVAQSKKALRIFALGIGDAVSSSLIEGVAKAGNGFAQSVVNGERLDSKVIRMLKGALTPNSGRYTLEVRYEKDEEDFVFVERVQDSLRVMTIDDDVDMSDEPRDSAKVSQANDVDGQARYNHLPVIEAPKLLQTPQRIPPLYPFSRTTVYILMSPEASQAIPKSVILRNDSADDPFEMEILVEILAEPSETIHQLAAKKAISELEEGRGWLNHALTGSGALVKEKHRDQFASLVEREAVRLGVQYQIAGKYTSFVAVEDTANTSSIDQDTSVQIDIVKKRPAPAPAPISYSGGYQGSFCSTRGSDIPTGGPQFYSFSSSPSVSRTPQRSGRGGSAAIETRSRAQAGRGGRSVGISKAGGCKTKRDVDTSSDDGVDMGFGMFGDSTSDRSASASPTPRWDSLQDLIALQTFEGFWELTPELIKIDDDFSQGEKQIPDGLSSKVWATMLAIQYLEWNEASKKGVWELVAEKARGWLLKQGVADENPGWTVASKVVERDMGF